MRKDTIKSRVSIVHDVVMTLRYTMEHRARHKPYDDMVMKL